MLDVDVIRGWRLDVLFGQRTRQGHSVPHVHPGVVGFGGSWGTGPRCRGGLGGRGGRGGRGGGVEGAGGPRVTGADTYPWFTPALTLG